jgi:hypothetical protein
MRLVVCLWIAFAAVLSFSAPVQAISKMFPDKGLAYRTYWRVEK